MGLIDECVIDSSSLSHGLPLASFIWSLPRRRARFGRDARVPGMLIGS